MARSASGFAGGLARQRVSSLGGHASYLIVSAALLALAFPRPGWGVLALAALAPAGLLAARARGAWRLAWTAWLVWAVWWLWMLRWVIPVTVPGYAAMSLFLALYPTAALLVTRWLMRGAGVAATAALPMAWVSLELLRGHLPAGGFAWFSLGHALGPWLPEHGAGRLAQSADLCGELGVSFLAAMTSGLLVDIAVFARGRARRRRLGAVAALWAMTFTAALVYGEWRLRQGEAAADDASALRVVAVQTNVPQSNKIDRDPAQAARDWAALIELTDEAAAAEPDLVVWPETVVPGFLDGASLRLSAAAELDWHLYHEQAAAIARGGGFALIVGAGAVDQWRPRPDDDGRLAPVGRHNSVFLYHADGTRDAARYDKMHLVPFGEYIPWVEGREGLKRLFLRRLSPYDFDYTLAPGRAAAVFRIETAGGEVRRAATPICFEDAVARVCRAMVWRGGDAAGGERKRVDVLVNLTNDAWFGGLSQRAQHLQIAAFRCIENRVPMVRSVNTGMSAAIDSSGRVVAVVEARGPGVRPRGQHVEGLVIASLGRDGRVTLYSRVGDWPLRIMAGATGLLALAGLRRRGKVTAVGRGG